ncbi:putative 2OG-Fe(II) oxygenase [Sphingomonas mesophila]|uniref:putative 2OG-Fe(II) oxygenase n=1 Tax=Sphingomonas mesophila TaxID=2303576 RepID=UPI000E56D252|nr:putative 2OG-Fe(II) oxygenase [Sphingomonas mesophila]
MNNPAALQSSLVRAQQLAAAGRHSEAWTVIAPLRSALDRSGQGLRLYALIAHHTGQIEAAIDALKRIVAIENSPPEILGALADALDGAGRSGEAAEHWTRLVRLRPDLADAHLNRTVTLTKAGKHVAALAAADEGLARFANHPRLLSARATALKNLGRLDEALAAFDRAIAADPARALVRYNQAVALRAACRFDESCAAYAEAARLGASGSEFHSNWAAAELEAGRVDSAADHYRRAISENPANAGAMAALTRLAIEYRSGEGAFDHYAERARAVPTADHWADWAGALIANERHSEAAEIGREGLQRVGAAPELQLFTAFAEGVTGDAAAALAELDCAPGIEQLGQTALAAKGQLALRMHDFARAASLAEQYNAAAGPTDQVGWSLLAIAWRMLGDEREAWLCDYERLVMVTEVPSPDGTHPPAEFARIVAAALDPLHQTLEAPGNQSLRNGTQTSGELFAFDDPIIRQFREAVSDAAAGVVAELPDDPAHPFLRRKSRRFGFSGSWSVRLRGGGGHHVPHFHGHGWMSSAYYARLPESGVEERTRGDGWIEFGRPPAMFDLDIEPRRVVEPVVGRLVLFPSFMFHGTRPFGAGKGDRLTAAFDYQPA